MTRFFLLLCIYFSLHLGAIGEEFTPTYISLGEDCQVALSMRDLNVRLAAYPFDWMISSDFDKLTQAFREDFVDFLNPQHMEIGTAPFGLTWGVFDNYYRLIFLHDFPNHEPENAVDFDVKYPNYNFADYLPEVTAKYERRLQRLRDVLGASGPVIFIRTATSRKFNIPCTPKQVSAFIKTIKKRYPQLRFLFVIVHTNPEFKKAGNWKSSKVYPVYRKTDSWVSVDEWVVLLKKIETRYKRVYGK